MKLGTLGGIFCFLVGFGFGIPDWLVENDGWKILFSMLSVLGFTFGVVLSIIMYQISDFAEQKRINAAHRKWVLANVPKEQQELALMAPPRLVRGEAPGKNSNH